MPEIDKDKVNNAIASIAAYIDQKQFNNQELELVATVLQQGIYIAVGKGITMDAVTEQMVYG